MAAIASTANPAAEAAAAPAQGVTGSTSAAPDTGAALAAKQRVAFAMRLLESAVMAIGSSSPEGKSLLAALRTLGTHFTGMTDAELQAATRLELARAAQSGHPHPGLPAGAPPQGASQ